VSRDVLEKPAKAGFVFRLCILTFIMDHLTTEHISPLEMKERGYSPVDLLKTFNEKGEVVGFAELQHIPGEIPFYYLQHLGNVTGVYTEKEIGVAEELIHKVNDFLSEKKSVSMGEATETINLANNTKGLYMVRVISSNSVNQFKLVVE